MKLCVISCIVLLAFPLAGLHADEGMWLFNNPPARLLQERYGFQATPQWMQHVQRASVRFNSGGSGSLVSSRGLVMTNHHVGADALQKLSTPQRDLLKQGFYAKRPEEELPCVDLELNVLMSIEDVTERVNAAVPSGAEPAEAFKARRAAMNTLEQESLQQTGLRSDVVTLYQGGRYHLYRYKKYTDVRLVFAPEQAIAFFGGDPDNFEYPRYDLDVCFFRAYEDGKPAAIQDFLAWSRKGVQQDELVFVSGHPGRTDRLNTVAHLEFLRDRSYPYTLNKIRRREVLLRTYSERGLENARRAQDELFGYQNTRKARLGGLAGLQDPVILGAKQAAEAKLRAAVSANPALRDKYGDAWDQVAAALEHMRDIHYRHDLLEHSGAFNTDLFGIARTLFRMADETAKPNADRLREYRESHLESLKQILFSEAPIYKDLETVKLADSLSMFMEMAGADNALVRRVLDGKSPAQRAAELIAGTRLEDVAQRKQLAQGGPAAIQACRDPMIELVRLVDAPARKLRQTFEQRCEEPLRQAYAKIANARFALLGTDTYPDATFTLRLAFGTVCGYEEAGQRLPPWTTIGGAFEHAHKHGSREPFALPESWLRNQSRLDPATPFNFLSTADIIGGNSGSPVVNRNAEVVGLIFDGNLQSLVLGFTYTQHQARALSVDCRAIVEALRKVYGAQALLDELCQ